MNNTKISGRCPTCDKPYGECACHRQTIEQMQAGARDDMERMRELLKDQTPGHGVAPDGKPWSSLLQPSAPSPLPASGANRGEPVRALLIKCFDYLGREIQTLSLNDSAALGVQALHKEIATFLDAAALPAPDTKGGEALPKRPEPFGKHFTLDKKELEYMRAIENYADALEDLLARHAPSQPAPRLAWGELEALRTALRRETQRADYGLNALAICLAQVGGKIEVDDLTVALLGSPRPDVYHTRVESKRCEVFEVRLPAALATPPSRPT